MYQVTDLKIEMPVYIRTDDKDEWPDHPVFYILASNGLFLCRNHRFFRSCTKVSQGPGELEDQKEGYTFKYPEIPRLVFEKVVGFFDEVWTKHKSEAIVLLGYNTKKNSVGIIVPEQEVPIYDWGGKKGGKGFAYMGGGGFHVTYEIPTKLPMDTILFGDIHSHGSLAAYTSYTDDKDEEFRPGLHIVVGYLGGARKDLSFHVEMVVDRQRWETDLSEVVEGSDWIIDYDFPKRWMTKVKTVKKEGVFVFVCSLEEQAL